MEFCPKCGKVMIMKRKSSQAILVCPKCGYEKEVKDEVIVTNIPKKRSKSEIILIEGEETKLLPITTDVVCPKCGNREAYWWTIQTRSADEPMTQFFRCTKCNHTWREYA